MKNFFKKLYYIVIGSVSANVLLTSAIFAQEAGVETSGAISLKEIGAGLAIGLAVLGGGLAQGKAASAAVDGIARNPGASDKVFTPFILGMALIESLVIFALLVAFIILL